jgi:hypothetical protein
MAAPNLTTLAHEFTNGSFNGLHLALVFFPIIMFFVTPATARPWLKYIFPLYILVPIHWPLFDDKCIFTVASIKLGALEDTGNDSSFSETYLRWLYEPVINAAGYCWAPEVLDKTIYLHWGLNYLLLSGYTFGYVYTRG